MSSIIGNGDRDIPAIQGSDIGDNEIINGTKLEQLGPDAFKLSFSLPSGRLLESAPFNSDFRRKAMLAWVDAVRQNIVADTAESAAAARRANAAVPPVTALDDAALAAQHPVRSAADGRVGLVIADPTSLIRAQCEAARAALDAAIAGYEAALEKKKAAEAAYSQWKVLLDVAVTPLPAPPPLHGPDGDTTRAAGAESAGRGRRRRRRKHEQTQLELALPLPPPESED